MTDIGAMATPLSGVLESAVDASALTEDRADIVSVGIDVVSVPKLSRLVFEGGRTFLDRGWTPDECAEANGDPERLATRWAAKEAVMKCLGLGISELDPRDIEVVSSESGVPSVVLRGSAGKRARLLGISKLHLSGSHESGWAVAIAVACAGRDQEILKCQLNEGTDNEY